MWLQVTITVTRRGTWKGGWRRDFGVQMLFFLLLGAGYTGLVQFVKIP